MIDYIAWLLEEETQEETLPPLERRELSLPPPRPQGDTKEQAEELPATAGPLPLQEGMAAVRAAGAAQALQSARRQMQLLDHTPAAALSFGAAAREEASARRRTEELASARLRGESAAGGLYARIREVRRSAEAALLLGERRAFAPEMAAGTQSDPFDLAALDRCFERDARRYDSGAE